MTTQVLSDERLRECPFCGGTKIVLRLSGDERAYHCEDCGCFGPTALANGDRPYPGEFSRAWNRRAAEQQEPVAQCCMCGKTGLSTIEGDGGPECQLSDGRWTCSAECYDRAASPQPPVPPGSGVSEEVFEAVLNCPHTIVADEIVLRRSVLKPGNAASQLSHRIRAALLNGGSHDR